MARKKFETAFLNMLDGRFFSNNKDLEPIFVVCFLSLGSSWLIYSVQMEISIQPVFFKCSIS